MPKPRPPLRIAVAQPACVPYDVAENATRHAAAVRDAGARVVVFPELSLTGYELDAAAISAADPRLAPIVRACADAKAIALAGAPVQGEAGRRHIAMLAIDVDGARIAYRKLWLSDEEAERFAPGSAPALLEVDGWRLGLAVCKDTGVPQHVADTVALGIDAYVAGTLMYPHEEELQDERARRIARERGIWVAFASFAGPTGGGYEESAGGSGVWEPGGAVTAQAGTETGAIARATLT